MVTNYDHVNLPKQHKIMFISIVQLDVLFKNLTTRSILSLVKESLSSYTLGGISLKD